MSTLLDIIKTEIADQGPIPVSRYFGLALGHAEHGYYMKQDPFGEDGDFTTAPEISQMFGEMVGLWSAIAWQGLGSPDRVELVELGPGRGTLMSDVLRAAGALPDFQDAARIHLVETSPVLRAIQKSELTKHLIMPAWHDNVSDVSDGPLIVLGNEFFDALPIEQYEMTADGWRQRLVDIDAKGGALVFAHSEPLVDLGPIPEELRQVPPGAIFEHSPASESVMTEIATRIVKFGGAALFFDYGHKDHGVGDTLQAVKAHQFHGALQDPGDCDLTAHVDFSTLASAALNAGAQVFGPVPQGAFLERLGMRQRADALMLNATPEQLAEIEAAYARLTAADQMGTLFKVMAVTSPGLAVPPWTG